MARAGWFAKKDPSQYLVSKGLSYCAQELIKFKLSLDWTHIKNCFPKNRNQLKILTSNKGVVLFNSYVEKVPSLFFKWKRWSVSLYPKHNTKFVLITHINWLKPLDHWKTKKITKVVVDNAAFLFCLLARVVLHMGYAVDMPFVSYYLQIRCKNHQFRY
jgi:hypothetical protein